MADEKRIELYKIWFDNMSFFGHNSFVLDTIEDLWNLTDYIINKYQDFNNYCMSKNINYKETSNKETICLVNQFLTNHDINLNLEQLIEDQILLLKKDVFKTENSNDFFGCQKNGLSHYDKDNKKVIIIDTENTILDSAVIVHELMHYRNQPDNKRNFTSDLLTEALSYGIELIFFEDLKDTIYHEDRLLHFRLLEKLMNNYMHQMYYIYKVILLYKTKKEINEHLYNELFNDGGYEIMMKYFDKYVQHKGCIIQNTWLVIGLPLAIYILEEYRKDKNFFNSVELFNSSLNDKSLNDCLSILNIDSNDDLKTKIKSSNNSFINLLCDSLEKEENKKVYQLKFFN